MAFEKLLRFLQSRSLLKSTSAIAASPSQDTLETDSGSIKTARSKNPSIRPLPKSAPVITATNSQKNFETVAGPMKTARSNTPHQFTANEFESQIQPQLQPTIFRGKSGLKTTKQNVGYCTQRNIRMKRWQSDQTCYRQNHSTCHKTLVKKKTQFTQIMSFRQLSQESQLRAVAHSFSARLYMPEVTLFLCAVNDYKKFCKSIEDSNAQYNEYLGLVQNFIEDGSVNQINIPKRFREEILSYTEEDRFLFALPTTEKRGNIFDSAYKELEQTFLSLYNNDKIQWFR